MHHANILQQTLPLPKCSSPHFDSTMASFSTPFETLGADGFPLSSSPPRFYQGHPVDVHKAPLTLTQQDIDLLLDVNLVNFYLGKIMGLCAGLAHLRVPARSRKWLTA